MYRSVQAFRILVSCDLKQNAEAVLNSSVKLCFSPVKQTKYKYNLHTLNCVCNMSELVPVISSAFMVVWIIFVYRR